MRSPRVWALVYILWSLLGLWVSIDRGRSSEFLGITTGLKPSHDFLFGMGAALAAPLVWLVALAALAILSERTQKPGYPLALAILFLGNVIGMLCEPIFYEQFSDPDPLIAVVIVGFLVIPILGARAAFHRRGELTGVSRDGREGSLGA